MARIAFVYPDFESLGVESLMAVCRAAGHEAELIFYRAGDDFLGQRAGSVPYAQIAAEVVAKRPDVVALSCVTDNFLHQLRCAQEIKRLAPEVFTIFGGMHPTAVPERVLGHDEVDAIAIGEGEVSLVSLLAQTRFDARGAGLPAQPIDGIVFKRQGAWVGELAPAARVDLDRLPDPYKAPFLQHLTDSSHAYRIATSRGCPYRCSYCYNSMGARRPGEAPVAQRSPEAVVAELSRAKRAFPVKYVLFVDDCFTMNPRWVAEFCRRYAREVGLPFSCISNPKCVTEQVVRQLADAGCVNMQIGIQSLSPELCVEVLQRESDNERVIEAIALLKKHRIMVQVDHMLGIPGDTVDNQERSILFYNEHRPDHIAVVWLTYYPRTAILEEALRTGRISPADVDAIESGRLLYDRSIFNGGSLPAPQEHYPVATLLSYLPLLPRRVVRYLVHSGRYRSLGLSSFVLSVALPRAIQALVNPQDYRGRSHLLRYAGRWIPGRTG